jgi:short-subunit dehydrogenase
MPKNLGNRVMVIAGASSGIGAATALACARAGMQVVLGARRVDRLHDVGAQIEKLGRRAVVVACDVRQDADATALIDAAVKGFGRIDAAFANAGYGLCAPVLETSDRQMRDIFETNYYGTWRVLKAAATVMRRQRSGHLLVCSSAASEVAPPMYGAYAATKAAQDSIACALRAELSVEGIDVTSIHPMGTKTEFMARVESVSDGRTSSIGVPAPMRHTPEYVARCILRCLRRPCAEVWPSFPTRLGVGIAAAFPAAAAWGLRQRMRKIHKATGEAQGVVAHAAIVEQHPKA